MNNFVVDMTVESCIQNLFPEASVAKTELVQSLWAGYGNLFRVFLTGNGPASVILKSVTAEKSKEHPHGWNTNVGNARKIKSYEVERTFYKNFSNGLPAECIVAQTYGVWSGEREACLAIEDLNTSGYHLRKDQLSVDTIRPCVKWLAAFHAFNLSKTYDELWEQGTYWYLDTRLEEFENIKSGSLKDNAFSLSKRIKSAKYKTLVHGDAKVANFCFNHEGNVIPVDFQYVGSGVGVQDLMYLLSSCMDDLALLQKSALVVDYYFEQLEKYLIKWNPEIDFKPVEQEWRRLYPIVWADFCRFLEGWSPGHYKLGKYAAIQTSKALDSDEAH